MPKCSPRRRRGNLSILLPCDIPYYPSSFAIAWNHQLLRTKTIVPCPVIPASAMLKVVENDKSSDRAETELKIYRQWTEKWKHPHLMSTEKQISRICNWFRSAPDAKAIILDWCKRKTNGYQHIDIQNYSTSWNDGMAFCALIHHFFPDAFDYWTLEPRNRSYNFQLAFYVAYERAGIYPLLDVEDMVAMRKPDWKSVFTYIQSFYRELHDRD